MGHHLVGMAKLAGVRFGIKGVHILLQHVTIFFLGVSTGPQIRNIEMTVETHGQWQT